MTDIDTRLYDSLENNISIDNSFKEEAPDVRIKLANEFKGVKKILKSYVPDFDFSDDVYNIIKTLNVKKDDSMPVSYDRESNELAYNYDEKEKDYTGYNELKSMMDIVTQRYDEKNIKQSGIITTDEVGNECLQGFNKILADKIILYTTGLKELRSRELTDEEENEIAKIDEKYMEFEKRVGLYTLVGAFAYARGEVVYRKYYGEEDKITL